MGSKVCGRKAYPSHKEETHSLYLAECHYSLHWNKDNFITTVAGEHTAYHCPNVISVMTLK